MYGLNHRFAAGRVADVTPIGARATVMVIERDPVTQTLVRQAVADHYELVVAGDSTDALALIDAHRPDVVMVDMSLDPAEIAMVTVALAACDELDSTPLIMLEPDQPTSSITLRRRIDDAVRVARRVYLGGGLRHRVAA